MEEDDENEAVRQDEAAQQEVITDDMAQYISMLFTLVHTSLSYYLIESFAVPSVKLSPPFLPMVCFVQTN